MNYKDFVNKLIEDGIVECTAKYDDQPNKLRGCVAGFKACRGLSPVELSSLLKRTVGERIYASTQSDPDKYWETRMKEAQIEFVCNAVSAALLSMGPEHELIVHPTFGGLQAASRILGTSNGNLNPLQL